MAEPDRRSWLLVVAIVWVAAGLGAARASALGDANQTSCSNEASPGFRSYLPDCRAYELVSPPYKQGFALSPTGYSNKDVFGAAPLATAASFGAFAGSPDVEGVNGYEIRRTSAGWETAPTYPASPEDVIGTTLYNFGAAPEAAEDGTALIEMHAPTESIYQARLYLRKPSTSASLIGPLLPPSGVPPTPTGFHHLGAGQEYAGASGDLSHVLFYINSARRPPGISSNLWPGDTTVNGGTEHGSLYEYQGVGHTAPTLVGLDNSNHLLGQCGIGLGGLGRPTPGNTHNAVAAGGGVVFVSATAGGCEGVDAKGKKVIGSGPPVAELYARLNGERTVAISEPSPGDCGACNTSSPQPANFEGASSDGSTAFFTTTQPLLGSDTDATKDLYQFDFSRPVGQRVVQVSVVPGSGAEVQGVGAISENGSHAYFVAHGVLTKSPNVEGSTAQAGGENLYLYERDSGFPAGRIAFVATLAESDSSQWTEAGLEPMNVTPDGRFLVFTSSADLTADDTSTAAQVFRYDAQTGQLLRISVGEGGFNNNGNTEVDPGSLVTVGFGEVQKIGIDTHPSVSNDGSVVVFSSSNALTPLAIEDPLNAVKNVYEYRAGHVYLISDGEDDLGVGSSLFVIGTTLSGVSSSGSDIFIASHDRLVPQDTDSAVDIYDARVQGGFPGPTGQSLCAGESCQRPQGTLPSLPLVGSTTAEGTNLVPPPSRPPSMSSARKLAKALTLCRKKRARGRRKACEAQARKHYRSAGPAGKATRRIG